MQTIFASNFVMINPNQDSTGTPMGLIWVVGSGYEATQYATIAQEFVAQAEEAGIKAWVGIPHFFFDEPNPIDLHQRVSHSMKIMEEAGFTGDNWYIAGHSLGGAMVQNYLTGPNDKAKMFKGAVLMGSVLTRSKREL